MNREIPEYLREHTAKNAQPKPPKDPLHSRRGELLSCDEGAPLAENFKDEFIDQRIGELAEALGQLGFPFVSTKIDEDKIRFMGKRDDGTIMEMIITKGPEYVSPKDYKWKNEWESE